MAKLSALRQIPEIFFGHFDMLSTVHACLRYCSTPCNPKVVIIRYLIWPFARSGLPGTFVCGFHSIDACEDRVWQHRSAIVTIYLAVVLCMSHVPGFNDLVDLDFLKF